MKARTTIQELPRLNRRTIVGAIACALVGLSWAENKAVLDVPYDRTDALRRLDFYSTASPAGPIIVYVHGGGFRQGDKRAARGVAEQFAAHGFNVAVVDYTLYPEATAADMVDEVCAAVKFLIADPEQFKFEPSHLVLMGHSAGAFLAALAASRISAAALVLLDGGALDLVSELQRRPNFCPIFSCDPSRWTSLSPLERLKAAAHWPPTFIAYGSARPDTAAHAIALKRALDVRGAVSEVAYFPSKTHTDFQRDLANPDDPLTRAVVNFLHQVLGEVRD